MPTVKLFCPYCGGGLEEVHSSNMGEGVRGVWACGGCGARFEVWLKRMGRGRYAVYMRHVQDVPT